jgi:aldehyde dehydrogenase (NAD+)
VQESIAPAFIEAVKARFLGATSALGADPQDPTTMLGPIADEIQFNRVMSYIKIGKEGGEPLVGGAQKGDKGFFIEPTIFLNPGKESRVYREEIFGPVLTIQTFKTEEEAIELANDTKTGLSCE